MDLYTTKFIAAISSQNVELSEENASLKLELDKLKEQISKMNEPRIDFNRSNHCCGKIAKGSDCQIIPETIISGKWY